MVKRIFNLIAEKIVLHSQLPFYQFLRDTSISPQAACLTQVLRDKPKAGLSIEGK
jgi:hypothetical protein